jgi:teichuronic acid exporter
MSHESEPQPQQLRRSGLNRAVKKGVAWVFVERFVLQGVNLLSSVVLARLLAPADFGVMGMVFLTTGLSSRLAQFGFGVALIRLPEIRREHVNSLFVLTFAVNGAVCLALIAAAPAVGRYFDNPLVGPVLAVMAFNFLIRSIATCPTALLRRRMDFRSPAIEGGIDAFVKMGVSIGLALNGYGVWSLVYAELTSGLTSKLYLAWAARWYPGWRVNLSAMRDLFGFGLGISLRSTLDYLVAHVDNFVIAKWLGAAPLGFYEKSYRLMRLPAMELSTRLNTVLFPAFARIQGEAGRVRAALRKSVLSQGLIGFPVFGLLVVLAPQIIHILYGARWAPSIVPFQILCIAGPAKILADLFGSVATAHGYVAPQVKRGAVSLLLMAVGSVVGVRWGIAGVATAVTLVGYISAALMLFILLRLLPIRVGDVIGPQRVPFAAGIGLVLVAKGLQVWTTGLGWSAFPILLVSATVGLLTYATLVFLLRDEAIRALYREFKGDVQPILARTPFAGLGAGR